MKEIEVRILDIDIENIRKVIKSLNAPQVKSEDQVNKIFDFSDKRLLKNKGYARIRSVKDNLKYNETYYMTVKKLIDNSVYKIMDEQEVIIDNPEIGENIFKSLGLILIEEIKKYRESYKYKNTLIEIDINDKSFCPFPYIEIESPSENELLEVVNLLGYSKEDITSKTIFDILNERGLRKNNIEGL